MVQFLFQTMVVLFANTVQLVLSQITSIKVLVSILVFLALQVLTNLKLVDITNTILEQLK